MPVTKKVYGTTRDGETVYMYTFTNKHEVELDVISWGATTVALKCPDGYGKVDDILLGFDTLEDYLNNPPYFGAIIGRVANRIAGAKFMLDGKEYHLQCNDPPNSLHGGFRGFTHVNWQSRIVGDEVQFTYNSIDGDQGYPGEVNATVTYSLTDENEMKIAYSATTTAATPLNMTNHCYFNLTGQVEDLILDHELQIHAEFYLPSNSVNIPTGDICPVKGTAFDFTSPKRIGRDIETLEGRGYDNNFCVTKTAALCARVQHSRGRVLEVYTDQPGVQLYTGNSLSNIVGKSGLIYRKYGAVCLEAQGYPNAVNQPNFPSVILRPGETYRQNTTYKLLAEKKSGKASTSLH